MAILKMQKIRLAVHSSLARRTAEILQNLGVLEISESSLTEGVGGRERVDYESHYAISKIDFAVDFLNRFNKQRFLPTMLEGNKVVTTEEEMSEVAKNFDYNEVVEKASAVEERLNDITAQLQKLSDDENALYRWRNLNIPLDSSARETEQSLTVFLSGDAESLSNFTEELVSRDIPHNIEIADSEHIALTYLKLSTADIDELTKQYGLSTVDLPEYEESPSQIIEWIAEERTRLEEERLHTTHEAEELLVHMPNLKKLADFMHWSKTADDAQYQSVSSKETVIFEGWCPIKYLPKVKASLESELDLYAIEEIEPAENEKPPVEIENHRLIKPFESVTRLYGMPGHKDIDPTLFLSGFFFLFFGLCLTDVGYGIFVASLIALIFFGYTVQKEMQPLLKLLGYGAVASALVGIIFGGYFGINSDLLPEPLAALQRFDPISDPLSVFYLSLGFGLLQITVGLILRIIRDSKEGSKIDAYLDHGPWIVLMIALSAIGGNMLLGISLGFDPMILLYTALVLLFITQGRKQPNILLKGLHGFLGIYNIVGIFSDILSYSRLLALGLATSALAFAINMIALLMLDTMPPVIGPILMTITLVIGHIFNIIVNMLGAFIHSARLQFVEFFGKFVTDTGRPFSPLKREERNVYLK